MHGPEVEVAFRRHVRDVRGDIFLLAEFPDLGRGGGVVDGGENERELGVQVAGEEDAVVVGYLVKGNAVGDFGVEARTRRDDGYFGVGVEDVEDAAGGYLGGLVGKFCGRWGVWGGEEGRGTDFSAADDEDLFIADLPCEEEGAAALDFGVVCGYCWHCDDRFE